jgi:hypothetical protein|tara:strand:+ start:135 stop:287 length:153 start_codon:yes stop_codon:yes gene_type:complete
MKYKVIIVVEEPEKNLDLDQWKELKKLWREEFSKEECIRSVNLQKIRKGK